MMLKPPAFWYAEGRRGSSVATALSPLGKLYGHIVARKIARTEPVKVSCPVICIGNVTMGGVGKTPFASWLASYFDHRNRTAHLLLRGYGGRLRGPVRVAPTASADDVGDEASMLSQSWPTWIARDRAEGAQSAVSAGADIIILDDGFQNPRLYKDFSFLMIDGETGLGNSQVFPAGPLRESPDQAIRRADAIVIVGQKREGLFDGVALPEDIPILHAKIEADISALPSGKPVVAFAGIGRPEKFFADLSRLGVPVLSTHSFPDHHPYTVDDLTGLKNAAAEYEAILITTEKDLMRLHPNDREGITSIPALFSLDETDELKRLMAPIVEESASP